MIRTSLEVGFVVLVTAASALSQVSGLNVNMVSGRTLPTGDPFLQRQNEPSIAISTRNPMHLLAGANDYRTVDIPGLPGGGDGEQTGDAWIGIFKSMDGGQTWTSTLLPGFPQDQTPEGAASPLRGKYQAGADVVVRSGTNGMVYMSGLAFNRAANTPSAIFIARHIDNNNKESGDSFEYLGTRIVASSEGGPDEPFVDKPWLAVDVPRSGAGICNVAGQTFHAGNAYLAYTEFYNRDNPNKEETSRIMLKRSRDCGQTWSAAIQLSDGSNRDQGASMAIDPANGNIYVAWRRARRHARVGQILLSRSIDGGESFTPYTNPALVANITPWDQPSSETTFRSATYPTLTVDHRGRIYVAWSEPGLGANEAARIVLTTSMDGVVWRNRTVVEPSPVPVRPELTKAYGHQVMPSLTFAGGKLVLVFYDTRLSHMRGRIKCRTCIGNPLNRNEVEFTGDLARGFLENQLPKVFNERVDDEGLTWPHTLDVRAGIAEPAEFPVFRFTNVSEYLFGSPSGNRPDKTIDQLRFNPPNLPLFAQGTRAFIGDYIDIGAAPPFVPIPIGNRVVWRANITESPIYHAVWTDNRDVRPPADGRWDLYTPPGSSTPQDSIFQPGADSARPACVPDRTGMRDQNIYSARISEGIFAGAPTNYKPLGRIPRAFVVFLQNMTRDVKTFRLTIPDASQPAGGNASFVQIPNNASAIPVTTIDVQVPPRSSVSRPVFVNAVAPQAQIAVDVREVTGVQGSPMPNGSRTTVLLNPDLTNPDLTNPDLTNQELYNPDLTNPQFPNPDLTNPDLTNPDLTNPDLTNPDLTNPDLTNPDLTNFDLANPDLTNPDLTNPDLTNGSLTDATWRLTNSGNTTASYRIALLLAQGEQVPNGVKTQLILYRQYTTPGAKGCELINRIHNVVLANIRNPKFTNLNANGLASPDLTNPDLTNPDLTNATVAVPPGESINVTVRAVGPSRDIVREFLGAKVIASATAHATNTTDFAGGNTNPPGVASRLVLANNRAADGVRGVPYTDYLIAYTPTVGRARTWAIVGALPQGLSLDSASGRISGTPTQTGEFPFRARVIAGPNSDERELILHIFEPLAIAEAALAQAQAGAPYSASLTATGGFGSRSWRMLPRSGSLPPGLSLSPAGVIGGNPTRAGEYTFTAEVRDAASPSQVATRSFTIRVLPGGTAALRLELVETSRVALNGTATVRVTLPSPALAVTDVNIVSATPGTISVPSPVVRIAAGQTSGETEIRGNGLGTTTLSATAPGYRASVLPVTVTQNVIVLGSVTGPLDIPLNAETVVPVSISPARAPAGGLQVRVRSSAPGIIQVVTPEIVTIPADQSTVNVTLRGLAIGSAIISATHADYASVRTRASTASLNIVEGPLSLRRGQTATMTLRFGSGDTPIPAPAPGLSITLSSSRPGCVSVPSPVTLSAGSNTVTFTVTSVNTATLPCTAEITANHPEVRADSVSVTVHSDAIRLEPQTLTLGRNLQRAWFGVVDAPGHGNLSVEIRSSNPTIVRVSRDGTTTGTQSVVISVPSGSESFQFFVHGVTNGGATITASALSVASGQGAVQVMDSGIGFFPLPESIPYLATGFTVHAFVGPVQPGTSILLDAQSLGAGQARVPVTFTSSNAAVAGLRTASQGGATVTAFIEPGASATSEAVQLDLLQPGTARLNVAASGFVSSEQAQQNLNVTETGVFLPSYRVGIGLQSLAWFWTGNPSITSVRVESTDPTVALVSVDGTARGAAVVNVPSIFGFGTFYVQGVQRGSAAIRVSAASFPATSAPVEVVAPAIHVTGLLSAITPGGFDIPLRVEIGAADPTNSFVWPQALLPDVTPVQVTITSSNSAAARLVPASGAGGVATLTVGPQQSSAGGVALRPVAPGTTTVSATAAGFAATSQSVQQVNVVAQTITLADQQIPASTPAVLILQLSAFNHDGFTVRLQSLNTAVATLSNDGSATGSAVIDVPVPAGFPFAAFVVNGISPGTATLRATAPGVPDATARIQVVAGP